MNRQIITPLLAAAVAIAAIPAFAQAPAADPAVATPAAAPAAEPAPAAAQPEVADAEVQAVAMLAAVVPKLTDVADGGPSRNERVYALLKALNLSFERYNAIATQAKTDEALGIRIAAAEPDEASVTAAVEATVANAQAAKAEAVAAAAAAASPAAQAAAQAAAGPPEPLPVLPTSGDGAVITRLLTNVCLPLVKGGDMTKLAKAAGMKKDSRNLRWTLPLAPKTFIVAVEEPGANKSVCTMHVRYQPGADEAIIDALNKWRFLSTPRLRGQRSDIGIYNDFERVTTTWDNYESQMADGSMVGLAVVQFNKKDGTATVNPAYDEADVRFQIRRAQPGAPGATAGATATPAG